MPPVPPVGGGGEEEQPTSVPSNTMANTTITSLLSLFMVTPAPSDKGRTKKPPASGRASFRS
jgi:hypothetical protein